MIAVTSQLAGHKDLPPLPPKRIFHNFDEKFVETRRAALELYVCA
jgi:hypothetical protein